MTERASGSGAGKISASLPILSTRSRKTGMETCGSGLMPASPATCGTRTASSRCSCRRTTVRASRARLLSSPAMMTDSFISWPGSTAALFTIRKRKRWSIICAERARKPPVPSGNCFATGRAATGFPNIAATFITPMQLSPTAMPSIWTLTPPGLRATMWKASSMPAAILPVSMPSAPCMAFPRFARRNGRSGACSRFLKGLRSITYFWKTDTGSGFLPRAGYGPMT